MKNLLQFSKEKITDNSSLAEAGWLFVCSTTDKEKNLQYSKSALSNGAVVVSHFDFLGLGENFHYKKNIANFLDELYPHNLKMIGITGTNGKTSIAYILHLALNNLGLKAGFIGTTGIGSGEDLIYSGYTTPPLLKLYQTLFDFSKSGYSHVVMEVSSHSIAQGRIGNIKFDYGILTNITQDHLDYHKDMTSYSDTKKGFLMNCCKKQVVNLDDPKLSDKPYPNLLTFGLDKGEVHTINREKNKFNLVIGDQIVPDPITLSWIGDFYISNFLAMLRVLIDILPNVAITTIIAALSSSKLPKGRMELVPNDAGMTIIVDFAHTPDALEKTLLAIKDYYPAQKITAVFGCAGNRDNTKRPIMGKVAENIADVIILTSDNPRFEDENEIINEILSGISEPSKVLVEPDRTKAIQLAIEKFRDSVIVVAGKGHEETQEIAGKSIKFSDLETIKKFI